SRAHTSIFHQPFEIRFNCIVIAQSTSTEATECSLASNQKCKIVELTQQVTLLPNRKHPEGNFASLALFTREGRAIRPQMVILSLSKERGSGREGGGVREEGGGG